MSDLLRRSAVELAQLVRAGELSATELVTQSLEAIAAIDPQINAFTFVASDTALAAAAEVRPGDERPFAGVPIAIKDNRAVANMPLTNGSDLFTGIIPPFDAHCVRRLRDAGFVIVGKTALPEFGILPTTESRRNGPTRNPWDLDRTPGGSSGGAAAAVAAGMVPIAHGNDGGGSIRIPASCCGLVGLKPARGRVSAGPTAGDSFLVADGVLTRDVADTAAVLDVLAGYELGDATWAPPSADAFAELARAEPGAMRIVLSVNPVFDAVVDPVCIAAARDGAALLQSLGHEVVEESAPWSDPEMLSDFTKAFGPATAMGVYYGGRLAGRDPVADDVEPLSWEMWERARQLNVTGYLASHTAIEGVGRSLVQWMSSFDAVLTPALAQRPVLTGAIHGRGPDPWGNYRRSGAFTPYTAIVNVTGLPAISLPLYLGDDGLPTAVQLIGRPAGEGALLSLAAQLQRALPWSQRAGPAFT